MRVAKDSKQGSPYGNSVQNVNMLYQDGGKATTTSTDTEYYSQTTAV